MKTLVLFIMLSILLACNANKGLANDAVLGNVVSPCPDDGTCNFEVLLNKKFILKTDEFGNSYSELVDGDKSVLKFSYIRHKTLEIEDSDYFEIIYIEIEAKTSLISLQDKDLDLVKAGFSRICFCKGQTGTFPIRIGSLKLTPLTRKSYQLRFDFTIPEVPQIIRSINVTFEQ